MVHRLVRLRVAANANVAFFDNLESLRDGFALQRGHDLRQQVFQGWQGLVGRADHDDAVVSLRRIGKDVGEVCIEGYEDSTLSVADGGDFGVRMSAEFLVEYRARIVPGGLKLAGPVGRKILVDFELHGGVRAYAATTRSWESSAA